MASRSEFNPNYQVLGDRVPQGIHAPRTRAHVEPPASSALLNTLAANAGIPATAVHSDRSPSPPTPQGDSPPLHYPPTPWDPCGPCEPLATGLMGGLKAKPRGAPLFTASFPELGSDPAAMSWADRRWLRWKRWEPAQRRWSGGCGFCGNGGDR